jgi:PAS domain S-box-containing protein
MAHVHLNQISRLALGITLIYTVFASVWIVLADPIIGLLVADPEVLSRLYLLKSGFFVFTTSILLFLLTYRKMQRIQRDQQHYQGLFEGSQDALLVIDQHGQILEANTAALQLSAYTHAELVHMNAIKLLPRQHRERFSGCLERFNMQQTSQHIAEYRLQTKPGRIIPVEVAISLIQFGKQPAFLCTARDITKRRQAEVALRQSEERFRTLIDAAPLGITLSRESTTMYANDAYRRMFGYTNLNEVYGTSFLKRVAPLQREQVKTLIKHRHIQNGAVSTYETVGQRQDGGNFPVHVEVTRIELADGPAELAFIADITARKQAEEVVIKSRDFQLSLFEEFPALIWRADLSGAMNYFNKTWLAFTGRTLQEEIDGWRENIPQEDLARCKQAFNEAAPHRRPFETEYRLRRHDGNYRWMLDYGRPFTDLDGTFAGYIGACYDITERKQAEEALREAEARLRTLIANAPITLFALDQHGLFTFIEGKSLDAFGRSQNSILGRSIFEVYQEYPQIHQQIQRALAGESFTSIGQIGDYTFETRWTPMRDQSSQAVGVIGVATDVTERHQAQIALQESEVNLRAIFDNAYQSVMLINHDYRIKSFNRFAQMAAISLYGKEMQVGRSILEYLTPEDAEVFTNLFQGTLKGETYIVERLTHGMNGEEWWELYYNPLITARGEISGVAFTARNITERKRAEEELRTTEERLRTVIASSPIILFAFDREGIFTVSEGKALETLGLTSGELVGRSIFEVYHNHPHMLVHARRALNGEAYTAVVRIDGLTFEMRLAPIHGKQGDVLSVTVVATDITDRQQAELLLRETEAREQAILNGTSDCVYLKDCEGRFLLVNPATAQLLGRDADELIGQSDIDLFTPDALEDSYRTDQLVLNTGQTYQTEVNWPQNGRMVTLLLQKSPHRDAQGRIQGIIGIGRDITARKRMERALQDARDVYLTLVEEAPMLVWRTNREGGCDFVNKQWMEFTGTTIVQAHGDAWLDSIHDLDRGVFRDMYTTALRKHHTFETEFRLCRYDGVYHWMVTHATPFFDENSEFAGYIGTCTDITERKRQEQIKDDFLALASHELKTPLAALIGYIHLLKRWSTKHQIDSRIEQALTAMSSESEQLDRLITDLLDVSRIQTGRLHMHLHPLNLAVLLERIVDSIQIVFPEHVFVREISDQVPLVKGDTQRLEQVIMNLCTNAAKYSSPSSRINVQLRMADRAVELIVHDRGLGIPPADLPYIFDRFYQVQRPIRESRPGLGLGLFITHEIVRQHGGTIHVDSVENHGSTFTVRLPITYKPSEEFSADADPTVHPSA